MTQCAMESAERRLKGLTLLARYGHVAQGGPSDQHEDELRLVLYYQLR